MCGGAIIGDFIPATNSWKLMEDYLYPDTKKAKKVKKMQIEIEDNIDFEADFEDFDDIGIKFEDDDNDTVAFPGSKPFCFNATRHILPSNFSNIFFLSFQFLLRALGWDVV